MGRGKSELRYIYEKYATVDVDDKKFMSCIDFLVKYLGWNSTKGCNHEDLQVYQEMFGRKGYLTFEEFEEFEQDARCLDCLHKILFKIFSKGNKEGICYSNFIKTLQYTNWNCNKKSDFIQLYFGKTYSKTVQFHEFPQFMTDLSAENAKVSFQMLDVDNTGYISSETFSNIILSLHHGLSQEVKDTIEEMFGEVDSGQNAHRTSFGYFSAFHNILNNIDSAKIVYLSASGGKKKTEVGKEEFLSKAQVLTHMTPLEVDILFQLCSLFHERGLSGPWRGSLPVEWRVVEDVEIAEHQCLITLSDLEVISPPNKRPKINSQETKTSLVNVQDLTSNQYTLIQLLESLYKLTLGSAAGAVGVTSVYPVDLVKTRMQNQRTSSYLSEAMYRNSWDCFRKVLNHEGFFGLYRGLLPQLVGVSPEKAIKLTVNDMARGQLADDKTGDLSLLGEIVAGGCGGAAQVVFTNPLEIVKIRLQVAGEISNMTRVSALKVVRDLGPVGLYKGSAACFLRDIPFSAIFFPAYAHLKDYLADSAGKNSSLSLLAAGCLAAIPAAVLVTPADVIKTRLQVKARHNQTSYLGVRDAAVKIYQEEGFRSFWKGSVARMCRSSPQFGVTLLAYEVLQKVFYVDFSKPESRVTKRINPDHIGGFKYASTLLPDMEKKFGIVFKNIVN